MVWIDQDATPDFHILSSSSVVLQFGAILTFAVVIMQQENQELTIIVVCSLAGIYVHLF